MSVEHLAERKPQPAGPEDAVLVERARAGSPEAFAALVQRYQDRVYNVCLRMSRQPDDALDLTQSTFLKALESLGHFEGRAAFYTWLFRIAINLAISQRRSRKRRAAQSFEEGDGELRVHRIEPVAGERLERSEAGARVQAALNRLDETFSAPVILRDVEGLDYAEIAQILDVPVGTVKSRISRGRMMLRDMLEDT